MTRSAALSLVLSLSLLLSLARGTAKVGRVQAAEKERASERDRDREIHIQRGVVGRPARSGTHWSYWRFIEQSTAARTHLEVLEGRMLAADGFDVALMFGITLTSPHCHLTSPPPRFFHYESPGGVTFIVKYGNRSMHGIF